MFIHCTEGKIMKMKTLSGTVVSGLVLCAASASGQIIVAGGNGSMTGTPGASQVPNGWTIVNLTPDTIEPGGISGAGFGFGPQVPASPDGGTFIGLQAERENVGATPGSAFAESVSTVISGLTAGEDYIVKFYFANVQHVTSNQARFDPGAINVDIAGGVHVTPPTPMFEGQGSQTWGEFMFEFNATAMEEVITFTAVDLAGVDNTTFPASDFGGVGLGIDGLRVEEAPAIPAPGAAAIFGLGGIAMMRRRR